MTADSEKPKYSFKPATEVDASDPARANMIAWLGSLSDHQLFFVNGWNDTVWVHTADEEME